MAMSWYQVVSPASISIMYLFDTPMHSVILLTPSVGSCFLSLILLSWSMQTCCYSPFTAHVSYLSPIACSKKSWPNVSAKRPLVNWLCRIAKRLRTLRTGRSKLAKLLDGETTRIGPRSRRMYTIRLQAKRTGPFFFFPNTSVGWICFI